MRPNRNILEKLKNLGRLTRSQWGKQEGSLQTARQLNWGVGLQNGAYVVTDQAALDNAIQRIAFQEKKEDRARADIIKSVAVQHPKTLAVATDKDAHAAKESSPYIDCLFKENNKQGSLKLPEETNFLDSKEVILIENAEVFREAGRIFPKPTTKIYYAGTISGVLLNCLANATQNVWLAPDYDIVGMQQWRRLKTTIPSAQLWLPTNLEELFEKFGKPIQGREPELIREIEPRIWEICKKTKRILHQEALLLNPSSQKTKT